MISLWGAAEQGEHVRCEFVSEMMTMGDMIAMESCVVVVRENDGGDVCWRGRYLMGSNICRLEYSGRGKGGIKRTREQGDKM